MGSKIALVLVVVCLVFPGRSGAGGRGEEERSPTFLLSALGCYLPIPVEFVVYPQDPERLTLSLRARFKVTEIVISPFAGDLGDSFVVVDSRPFEDLVVENLRHTRRPETHVTRISDMKQQVMIYGGDDTLVDSMLAGCASLGRGDLFRDAPTE